MEHLDNYCPHCGKPYSGDTSAEFETAGMSVCLECGTCWEFFKIVKKDR